MTAQKIAIFDTTLRDGEQSPGCSMDLAEKLRMARQLELLGVDIIEAGFPISSEGDFAAVKAIATACRKVTVAALCRTAEQDVARAADALAGAAHPRIHTFVATSDIHLEHKLQKTRDRSSRDDARLRATWRATMRKRLNFPPKTRRAVTWTIFAKSSPPPSKRAPRSSTCLTLSATRLPSEFAELVATGARASGRRSRRHHQCSLS